jgi:hypothetical protein
MTVTEVPAGEHRSSANGRAQPEHRIDRRTGLPGSRAVVGALLMALAAVGVYLAHAEASRAPTSSYVVAAIEVRPGATLTAADLELAVLDLPARVAARAFRSTEELVGRVALGPIGAGEVIQAGALSTTAHSEPAHEVALVLPRAHVAVGRLQQGDRIDVFATDADQTTTIVRGALVVSAPGAAGGAIGQVREVELVVAVPSGQAVAAVVHALRTSDVTVVRSTFAEASVEGALTHRRGDAVTAGAEDGG